MSVELEKRTDTPGEATHEEAAWALKERIRREDGVLKQRRGFFSDAYRRSTTHLLFERGRDDRSDEPGALVGFVSARRDGYVLFLAVSPDARGRGYGRRLVGEVAEQHRTVTCHARATNGAALDFYEAIGFDVERRITGYYEDGGDALYLKLGEQESLTERLSNLLR
ncbi:GNAT family N-acetyltransferase [Halobaculum sp. MBLA0143]|uniref:GNAT family N-acetyltransferase n=1 Tax=Halobaculum sp. MBLA0143 TaxID=3079933 RepID=UPI0035257524